MIENWEAWHGVHHCVLTNIMWPVPCAVCLVPCCMSQFIASDHKLEHCGPGSKHFVTAERNRSMSSLKHKLMAWAQPRTACNTNLVSWLEVEAVMRRCCSLVNGWQTSSRKLTQGQTAGLNWPTELSSIWQLDQSILVMATVFCKWRVLQHYLVTLNVDGLLLGIVKLVLSARLDSTNCDLCCHSKISFNEQLYTLIFRMMFRPCSFAGSKLCCSVHSGIRSIMQLWVIDHTVLIG